MLLALMLSYSLQDAKFIDSRNNDDITHLVLKVNKETCIIPIKKDEIGIVDIDQLIEEYCVIKTRTSFE